MQIEEDKWWSKLILPAVLVIMLVLMAGAVWWISRQISGTRRDAPPVQTITLQPPPPPPPPVKPPEPKPVEPEKTIEEPKPVDKPQEAPQQLTIAGPPQAGGDAFGIQSGSGQGRTLGGTPAGTGNAPGGSFGDSAYRRYMSSTLQQAMQSDSRVNRQAFSAEVLVWVDRSGRVSRVSIARSSGNAKTDQNILAVLRGVRLDEAPNPAMQFPQRATVRGRKT